MTSQKLYRLSRSGKLLLLKAAAGGIEGRVAQVTLLVDTGSTYTILPVKVLEALGCDLENPLRQRSLFAASGTISAPVVAIPWFSCLGQRVNNFPVLADTIPSTTLIDGVLGMDFMTSFQAVILVKEAQIQCKQQKLA